MRANVRIRLTELGWKGLLLLLALVVAFLATAYHNLFFLLLAFACATAMLGAHGAFAATNGVRLTLPAAPLGPAGEALRTDVQVQTADGANALAVMVQIECAGKRHDLQSMPVLQAGARCSLSLPALPRGVHSCRLWLVSRYPLGLIEVARAASDHFEVVSHPKPRPAPAASATAAEETGADSLLGASQQGAQIAGLRPFVRGDALALIHWKASARRGSPVVKEREPEHAARRDLWLDRSGADGQLESRLAVVTGQLLSAVAKQESVRLRSQGMDSGWLAARSAAHVLLRQLAAMQPLETEANDA